MLGAAITFAFFGFVLTLVVGMVRRDGAKIIAALEGNSQVAEESHGRLVIVRFSPRYMAEAPVRQPVLRAAA